MTDMPDKRHENDEADADFEGHRLAGPERMSDIVDGKKANDDEGADFEGHRLAGPEKISRLSDITDVRA